MEIALASVQYDTFDIDFQKVFDFMKNKGELENTVYDYGTDFGDNTDYYLEHVLMKRKLTKINRVGGKIL